MRKAARRGALWKGHLSWRFFHFTEKEVKHTETGTGHRFTDAEMEIARGTDLPDLLEHLGYQVMKIGRYHTTKEMDSLRIKNRRTWRRYSENTGGDAITFLQRFCSKSFPEAVEYLLNYHGRTRDSPARPHPKAMAEPEKIPFALPQANTDHRRVFAYLQKRGIAPQVIRAFLSSGLLYEDAQHHNCVFVGRDASGEPRFASRRGTYDLNGPGFKRDVAGSDKRVAFRLPSRPELDWVLVFEAPIDLMSYADKGSYLRGDAIACDHAYVSRGTLLAGHARVEDDAYIRGAVLTDHARASGFAVIVYNQDTGGVPMLSGQSAVYGRVSGDVRLTDTALVISGEEIQNDTLDTLVISGQGRSVIRDDSRDELVPQTGQPEPSKAKIKERQVER